MLGSWAEHLAHKRKGRLSQAGRKMFTATIVGFVAGLACPTASLAGVPNATFDGGIAVQPVTLPSGNTGTLTQSHIGTTPFDLYAKGANDPFRGEEYDVEARATSSLYLFGGGDLWFPIPSGELPALGGSAEMTYYAEVSGPPDLSVPLNLDGSYKFSVGGLTGDVEATADVSINYGFFGVSPGGSIFKYVNAKCIPNVGCSNSGPLVQAGSFDVGFDVTTNVVFGISLLAAGSVDVGQFAGYPGRGGAGASLDPVLSIPAAFLADHPGISLELSSNVTQPIGSIPEPSTWVMMLAGFAGVGFLGWRGSRKTAVRTPRPSSPCPY